LDYGNRYLKSSEKLTPFKGVLVSDASGEILQAAQIVDVHVTADDVSDWLSIDAHQE